MGHSSGLRDYGSLVRTACATGQDYVTMGHWSRLPGALDRTTWPWVTGHDYMGHWTGLSGALDRGK